MTNRIRLTLAIGLALAWLAVPVPRVVACSCMFLTPQEAATTADAAFVGTVLDASAAAANPNAPGGDAITYAFAMERSRQPISGGTILVTASLNNGGNCGITFQPGERWFIAAYRGEGMLSTTSCGGNVRLDGLSAAQVAELERLLPTVIEALAGPDRHEFPAALWLAAAVALAASALATAAFRYQRDPDD